MLDVVEDHFEVLVVEGGSRSAESSCGRWCHVIVSPSHSARLRCWSRCFPHRLQGWTFSRLMMQYHDDRENQILALCVFVLDSTGFPVLSWTCMTRLSSHSTGFSVLSEEPSSSCKRLPTISCEWDVFPLSTKTCSVSTGFPVRSQIGLGLNWVGLEDSARGASSKDCWTSFPTGCCSTVEPDWSFPLVQLWSCFNEILGGGRGDKYRLSYNISIFQLLKYNGLEVFLEE